MRPPAAPSHVSLAGLLLDLRARGGSDLHLAPGIAPRGRIHGDLEPLLPHPLAGAVISNLLRPICPPELWAAFDESGDADLAWESAETGRFRVNLFRERRGPGAIFRQIPTKIPTVDELGLPARVVELAALRSGLVLVTGPTGSGKSTTLAAILDRINRTRDDHIVTVEEPVEFVHPSRRSMVTQREVGSHTRSFRAALRSALREDPDVLLVGEMRDLDTVALGLAAAEAGLLVFGTLHTNSAAKAVDRVVDVFPAPEQAQARGVLAGTLQAVLSQVLLKRADGKGRVAAIELLTRNVALTRLIRTGDTHMIEGAFRPAAGDRTMDQALVDLVQRGLATRVEAWPKLRNRALLEEPRG